MSDIDRDNCESINLEKAVTRLEAEVRRQRNEIAKLRDALEPFAMKVNDGWNDNDVFHITSNPTLTGPTITAGNVRAAAKALEETK